MTTELDAFSKRVAAGDMTRREFMNKAAALGVSAAVASSMLASAAEASETPVAGGTFRMGVSGGESTNSQDPATWASDAPIAGGFCWGEMLAYPGPEGLEPRVAESWEGSADAKVWRFKVRQGIKFSNGQPVTAQDVLATMERHSDEESKSGALGIMKGIESMRVDGDVFELTLGIGNADLPFLMGDYHLIIQPNGGKDAPGAAIGTGPYTLETDEPGVRMTFKRRPDYWGGDQTQVAHYDNVEVIVLNDATARTAALQSGQVDTINRVEPKIAKLLDRAPTIDVKTTSGRGHYVFIMHIDTAPFDKNELRLALKYALNRQEMVDKILQGYGSIGNDIPINASYPLFNDMEPPQREFDLAKAAEHYKKSGHDGSPIVLRTADGAFPGAVDAAALFQQSCQAAGIPLEIKREPNDGYWSEVWNVQPFCCSYWGGRPVQDQMYSTAYLSTADWNDTRWKNETFDELLFKARAELDEAKRKEIYTEMAMMLWNEGGLMVPMFNDFVDAISTNVKGWETNPSGPQMYWTAFAKTWKA